jgi:hypothetical protein
MDEGPPRRVVEQRIRNRIMETLERVVVPNPPFYRGELLDEWEDWIWRHRPASFPPPVYTPSESAALLAAVDAFDAFIAAWSNTMPDTEALHLREWTAFVSTCQLALSELSKRGPLSEDVGIEG